jgi:hypothetical protein
MSIALFDFDDALIPRQLREIADNTSERIALVLLETYPGTHVYIPPEPVEGHRLFDRLTLAEFSKLCAVYGKCVLKIARADKAIREQRNQLILKDYFTHKLTQGSIAVKYGLTEEWVGRICNSVAISSQMDLFE